MMKCDEANRILCEQAESDKNADYNFKGNDFMVLFCADVSKIGKDEDLQQRYGELEQNYEVLQQKYNAQQQDYNSLNTAQSKMTSDYENAQKEISTLQKQLDSLGNVERSLKQYKEKMANSIVWWNSERKNYKSLYPESTVRFEYRIYDRREQYPYVRAGDPIAYVRIFTGKATTNYKQEILLRANNDGYVFYQITSRMWDIGQESVPVAIIVDTKWWLNQNK